MGVFEDVNLEWDGKTFVVPSDQVMGAIARVEEHVTLKELSDAMSEDRGRIKFSALARAFASVLRYAGAKVTDEEVYAGMFDDRQKKTMFGAVNLLLGMMIPPDAVRRKLGEPSAGKAQAAASSSPRRSRQRRNGA